MTRRGFSGDRLSVSLRDNLTSFGMQRLRAKQTSKYSKPIVSGKKVPRGNNVQVLTALASGREIFARHQKEKYNAIISILTNFRNEKRKFPTKNELWRACEEALKFKITSLAVCDIIARNKHSVNDLIGK